MAVSADHQQLATLSAPTDDPDSQSVQQEVRVHAHSAVCSNNGHMRNVPKCRKARNEASHIGCLRDSCHKVCGQP
jgi:hypothetical protein